MLSFPTTALRFLLLRAARPISGITSAAQRGAGVDPISARRTIGMVFQRLNPFPTMSIRNNVLAWQAGRAAG